MAVAACAVCAAPYARVRARERRVAPRAGLLDGIFGGGGGGADDRRKRERDEQLALQRQKLEERRAGTSLRGFQERRAKIAASMRAEREERATRASRPMAEFLKGREAPADRGRAGAAPGRRMYDGKEDAPTGFGNIIIPQIPIGIEKYDRGDRFDLAGKYVDEGWVDEDAGSGGLFGGLFGGGKDKGDKTGKRKGRS